MVVLRGKLKEFGLQPEETRGDGNCLFRAVSRMMYADDSYHSLIRRQAVERIDDYPEDYLDYVIDEYGSVENYIIQMAGDGVWADNAAIRATADALQVEIHIISSGSTFIPTFQPDSRSLTQKLFLGHISQLHYVSTISETIPQTLSFGGVSSDGTRLDLTSSADNSLTWIFNLLKNNSDLEDSFKQSKTKVIKDLINSFQRYLGGNSVDAKKLWYECLEGKSSIYDSVLNMDSSDAKLLGNFLKDSVFGQLLIDEVFEGFSNDDCLWKLPSKSLSFY